VRDLFLVFVFFFTSLYSHYLQHKALHLLCTIYNDYRVYNYLSPFSVRDLHVSQTITYHMSSIFVGTESLFKTFSSIQYIWSDNCTGGRGDGGQKLSSPLASCTCMWDHAFSHMGIWASCGQTLVKKNCFIFDMLTCNNFMNCLFHIHYTFWIPTIQILVTHLVGTSLLLSDN